MGYAIPILLLVLTIAAFFGMARGKFASFGIPQFLLCILVALPLLFSGITLHFFHAVSYTHLEVVPRIEKQNRNPRVDRDRQLRQQHVFGLKTARQANVCLLYTSRCV